MSHIEMTHDNGADKHQLACIATCNKCHETCLHTAMTHCLEAGGKNVEAGHFRLMINCAEICQITSNFMLSGSAYNQNLCSICADVCDACANSCEQVGGMEACVKACRECAESCRKMASAKH